MKNKKKRIITKFPARLHVIIAREAPVALVFRRGPARFVCTLRWDLRTHQFQLGQWLHGRIYERQADLSPDGKHLIYFAANFKPGPTGGTWTAVSRTPWLRALALHAQGDTYGGGGLFIDNRRYWLNGDGEGCHFQGGASELRECPQFQRDRTWRPPLVPLGDGCLNIYFPHLLRGGWQWVETGGPRLDSYACWQKELPHGWRLVKLCHAQTGQPPGKGCYWDEHYLEHPESGQCIEHADWEWADWTGRELLWAQRGCLFRAGVGGPHGLSSPTLVLDLNPLQFEARRAPYQ